jgi:hypothetical protein
MDNPTLDDKDSGGQDAIIPNVTINCSIIYLFRSHGWGGVTIPVVVTVVETVVTLTELSNETVWVAGVSVKTVDLV